MKNPEMLKFIPGYLQTKKCVKMQLKITFCRTLESVPDCYKNQ